MHWILIIYYFIAGPGGWHESERIIYPTKQECIEYRDFFNEMPKPGTLMARCKRADTVS